MNIKSLNLEKIQKRIFHNFGSDYEYISDYKGFYSRIRILHKTCGRTFSKSYSSINQKSTCNRCNGREKSTGDMIQYVQESLGKDFLYKGGYETNKSFITIHHNKCNSDFKFSYARVRDYCASNLFECSVCKPKTWDIKKVKKHIKDSMGSQYKYISGFKNSHSIVMIKHLKCSHEFKKNLKGMDKIGGCPICDKGYRLLPSEFIKKLLKLKGKDYKLINYETSKNGYIITNRGLVIKHTVCNYIWKTSGRFLNSNNSCLNCSRSKAKNTDIYKKEVIALVGREYIVLGEYLNTGTPIEHLHVECGHHFLMRPNNFKRGQRCPIRCEFTDNPSSNWRHKFYPYPIKVKPDKILRDRPDKRKKKT
jgi:hypothetical protein